MHGAGRCSPNTSFRKKCCHPRHSNSPTPHKPRTNSPQRQHQLSRVLEPVSFPVPKIADDLSSSSSRKLPGGGEARLNHFRGVRRLVSCDERRRKPAHRTRYIVLPSSLSLSSNKCCAERPGPSALPDLGVNAKSLAGRVRRAITRPVRSCGVAYALEPSDF